MALQRLGKAGAAVACGLFLTASAVFAEGLYVRAGLGLDASNVTRFMDQNCMSTIPPALYGCGAGIDGEPLSSSGDFGRIGGFELGLGHDLASAFRLEAALQYRPEFSFSGRANFLKTPGEQPVTADVSSMTAMFSGYIDLAELGAPQIGPFSPFVGAGIGLSWFETSRMRMEFPGISSVATTTTEGGENVSLAWLLTAGLETQVSKKVSLDLAYRYSDLGKIKTDAGAATIVRNSTFNLDIAGTEAVLASHGVWASLRYDF